MKFFIHNPLDDSVSSEPLPSNKGPEQDVENAVSILNRMRSIFVNSMMDGRFATAVEVMNNLHAILSSRISDEKSQEIREKLKKIESSVPEAEKTYLHNGALYYVNGNLRSKVKSEIYDLYRELEKLRGQFFEESIKEEIF